MSALHHALRLPSLAVVVALAVLGTSLLAAERPKGVNQRVNADDPSVDLFAGIGAGQLEAKLIVKDSTRCRVMVKNLTDGPLNVRLPEAVAGVPVLAQFANPAMQQNPFPNNNANNAPQQIGMGFPQNNGMQNNGFQNNMFNLPNNPGMNNRGRNPFGAIFSIPPEKVAQFKLACVCLDHGNPEPKPQMAYEIRPLKSAFPDAPGLSEVCAMLGRSQISQRAAQAAAWHFANGMTWKQLKAEQRTFAMGTIREPFFTARELAAAKKAAGEAEKLAADRKKAAAGTSLSRD